MHSFASIPNQIGSLSSLDETIQIRSPKLNRKPGLVIWLCGLSGAGKSTIGDAALETFWSLGIDATRLDGDDLRSGLNKDLGFSDIDRTENLRRAAHVAQILADHGFVVLASFITPLQIDRNRIREIIGSRYLEVFIGTSLEECERRDPKGLYKLAREGKISQFTGVSSKFEFPENPDLIIQTEKIPLNDCVCNIINLVEEKLGK